MLFFWFPNVWHVHILRCVFESAADVEDYIGVRPLEDCLQDLCEGFAWFFFVLKSHSPPPSVLNMEPAATARWASFNGQSTYPHGRYPHDKEGLNKGLLTIIVPLIRPCFFGVISHWGHLTWGYVDQPHGLWGRKSIWNHWNLYLRYQIICDWLLSARLHHAFYGIGKFLFP